MPQKYSKFLLQPDIQKNTTEKILFGTLILF